MAARAGRADAAVSGTACSSWPTCPGSAAADPAGAARLPSGSPCWPVAASDAAAEVPGLRRYWHKEGGVAISSAGLEMVLAGRRGDPAAVLAVYDDVVAELSRSGTSGSPPGSAWPRSTIGALAATVSSIPASERAAYVEVAERLYRDGHTVLERYADPSGFWGPEGRAWVKLLEAELLRIRWLCGVDAPPADVLVDIWREAVVLFEDYGDVYEIARVPDRPRRGPARRRRPGRRPEVGDRARATARQLGAQPLLDDLRSLGSGPAPQRHVVRHRSPRASARSWPWSRRAAPTARSASSCSSAPRPSASTSPTSSASSTPPDAPRPPRSRVDAACWTDALQRVARRGTDCPEVWTGPLSVATGTERLATTPHPTKEDPMHARRAPRRRRHDHDARHGWRRHRW